jgi:hypothetical protein
MAYMPIISDVGDAGKNMFGAVNHGYDVGRDLSHGNFKSLLTPRATRMGSLGGMLSAFGGVGMGAAAGAVLGTQIDSDNMGRGAATGAAVGAAAAAVAPFALGMGMSAGVALGKGALNLGASAVSAAPGVALGAAKLGTEMINGVGFGGVASTALSPVRRWGQAASNLGNSLFSVQAKKLDPSKVGIAKDIDKLTHVRPTVIGGIALAGISVLSGLSGAHQQYQKSHMGMSDGQVTRATPKMQSQQMSAFSDNNAGASGDLVFALNKNRRG